MRTQLMEEVAVTMNALSQKEGWESDFLTRISHEMRTPLTTIIGYSEVMLSDPKLPQEAKQEYVEIIRNAGRRLSEFLEDYLESEVIQQNRQLADKRREDFSLLTQRACANVADLVAAKSVTIDQRCDPGIYIDGADPDHLVHILENLIANAIAIAPEGGHIEIRASQRHRFTAIEIINQDRGFLGASLGSVTKSFRWIQSPGIEIHHEGLGLAFAKHVVELEGGLLNIQGYEQGLTFTLQFPRAGNN
ncbi:MAG TPA: histidine kinase dimerization/phospho-acceptor domain-containing protein [Bacteroidota bacterium]|nr:histidine kinase dimerization/phospho-acceptor domain-containing protein [Bacteroidota bacterium]